MYRVIKFFTDLQDNEHPYHVGDAYPREGVEADDKRIKELSTTNNRQRVPLIEKAEEPHGGEREAAGTDSHEGDDAQPKKPAAKKSKGAQKK